MGSSTLQGSTPLSETIRQSEWGSALAPDELQFVIASTREVKIRKNGVVVHQGDAPDFWIGVLDGLVVQVITSEAGKTTELATAGPGVWFGEGTLIKEERWRYDVLAMAESRVALVPRDVFAELRRVSLPFNHYLQKLLNLRVELYVHLLSAERLLAPEGKVARILASFYLPGLYPDRSPFLAISQQDFALLSGLSRPRINVALKKLEELGLIEIQRTGIVIRDLTGIRNFSPE